MRRRDAQKVKGNRDMYNAQRITSPQEEAGWLRDLADRYDESVTGWAYAGQLSQMFDSYEDEDDEF